MKLFFERKLIIFFSELSQIEDLHTNRITRILTNDFPHYFAVVSRIRQEIHAIGPDGGTVSSTAVPLVQAVFPPNALTKKIRVGLQVICRTHSLLFSLLFIESQYIQILSFYTSILNVSYSLCLWYTEITKKNLFKAQAIESEIVSKLLGHGVAISPIVTVEPRRRKFHKAITLSLPAPRAHTQGMINQYSGSAPTLRLLCSITGEQTIYYIKIKIRI